MTSKSCLLCLTTVWPYPCSTPWHRGARIFTTADLVGNNVKFGQVLQALKSDWRFFKILVSIQESYWLACLPEMRSLLISRYFQDCIDRMVSHKESLGPRLVEFSTQPSRTCVRTFSRKGFPGPECVNGSRKQTKEDYSLWHERTPKYQPIGKIHKNTISKGFGLGRLHHSSECHLKHSRLGMLRTITSSREKKTNTKKVTSVFPGFWRKTDRETRFPASKKRLLFKARGPPRCPGCGAGHGTSRSGDSTALKQKGRQLGDFHQQKPRSLPLGTHLFRVFLLVHHLVLSFLLDHFLSFDESEYVFLDPEFLVTRITASKGFKGSTRLPDSWMMDLHTPSLSPDQMPRIARCESSA